ncbi:MAG: NAD(P)H-hydrate dehydratase [Methanocellales archaeon]|nr:NAD(P)H-hydrate dehydratase [Methanocellales archaeon]
MTEAITSKRMRAIDINSEYVGVSRADLMENAGRAVADAVRKRFDKGKITILAGRGNNGGDAFVAARHLKGFDVQVMLLGSAEDIKTKEAKVKWDRLKDIQVTLTEVRSPKNLDKDRIMGSDVIIDAIFGTGIAGKIKELESTAMDLINASNAFVISVDVPSGMNPDTGKGEKIVHPDLTITFHKMKRGLIGVPNVRVADIGIPEEAELFAGPGDLQMLGPRRPESHKGDNGRILVVGGGAYVGAPALTALAALRAGADIATVAAPSSVSDIIASFSPNLIVSPLTSDVLVPDDVPIISELISKHDVVVIGMGLGKSEPTARAIRAIVPLCKKAVIDADALSVLEFPLHGAIITPHAGEFKSLSKLRLPRSWKKQAETIKKFAKESGAVVLLKGKTDIISDGERIKANKTGNAGMTVGGTGDVLAGVVGALYATNSAFEAAVAGAFINGRAGDLAFEEWGFGLLATDVIDNIPKAMKV